MNFVRTGWMILLLTVAIRGIGQTPATPDPLNEDLRQQLPPLEALIDSALAHNPNLKLRSLQLIINQCRVNDEQFAWLRNFGLQANLGYGTFDYLYNNTIGGATPPTYTTQQNQTQYGVGAYIRFPIYDLIGRRNKILTSRAEMDQARALSEVQTKEIRAMVITLYNELVERQHLLKISVKYIETARINMQMAEKEFANGTITLSEFARMSETSNRAETDLESQKMKFLTAFMLLEEAVGMKLNKY